MQKACHWQPFCIRWYIKKCHPAIPSITGWHFLLFRYYTLCLLLGTPFRQLSKYASRYFRNPGIYNDPLSHVLLSASRSGFHTDHSSHRDDDNEYFHGILRHCHLSHRLLFHRPLHRVVNPPALRHLPTSSLQIPVCHLQFHDI